jgi:hypothetical protein
LRRVNLGNGTGDKAADALIEEGPAFDIIA